MPDIFKLYERLKYLSQKNPEAQGLKKIKTISPLDFTQFGFNQKGEYTFYREFKKPNPLANFIESEALLFCNKVANQANLLFFDTETTGLSGGAGTFLFLLGLGRIKENEFEIQQYFLADFAGEKEFLDIIEKEFKTNWHLVSYNGRAYDLQILKNRFCLNGKEFPAVEQTDLLLIVRRLWKTTLGSCSLKNIEANVLGLWRQGDIDGSEVPLRYFSFLRTKNPSLLKEVFSHNTEDVYSLAILAATIEELLRKGRIEHKIDPVGLAFLLLPLEPFKAEKILVESLRVGNLKAGLILGYYYKKSKRRLEALNIWEFIFSEYKNFEAGLELAKLYEHHTREYEKAYQIVCQLFSDSQTDLLKESLFIRKKRLEKRILDDGSLKLKNRFLG